MKRVFLLVLCLVAIGGGLFLSQPTGANFLQSPSLKKIETLAIDAKKTASREFSTRLAAAQTKIEKDVEPKPQQLSKWEKMLCDMANAERKKRGLSPMKIDAKLAVVARAHSREMMQKKYFAHNSPTATRRTVLDRYRLTFRETPRLVAENLYVLKTSGAYRLSDADIRRAHEGWMKSPGHRANILRTKPLNPGHIGVGIVVKGGSFWATQNFSTPF
ncbi:MAG TPA: CAP domain-containing protein [Abditibacteriaceae bacterium]|jgi:uncharacterized protein YkwD